MRSDKKRGTRGVKGILVTVGSMNKEKGSVIFVAL